MTTTDIPSAPGENFFGHTHLIRGSARLDFLRRAADSADIARMRVGPRAVYLINTPVLAHELLVENARKVEKAPGIRILLHDLAGQGLFTSLGDLWHRQRKLLSPLFRHSELAGYVAAMNEEALAARARMQDGARINLAHEMMRITMGVVGRTLFGTQNIEDADRIGEALTVLLTWIDKSIGAPPLSIQVALLQSIDGLKGRLPGFLEPWRDRAGKALEQPALLPGRHSPEMLHALDVIDTYVKRMIDERRASPTSSKDLLARLLLARDGDRGGEGMSDKQVRDEANTLFVAGHETTASALSWAFYLLSRNPEALARVQAEADAFGPDGPTSFDPEKLAYTSRVFKEALRMYPPVVMIPRRNLEPVEIGGHHFSPRTLFFTNVIGMHHRADIYPDPDRFDPDRFLPEAEAERHRSAWIPFSIGPRVCIGNFFALMEGPVVLATLMRGARFEVESRVVSPEMSATLRPSGGVWAKVHRIVADA